MLRESRGLDMTKATKLLTADEVADILRVPASWVRDRRLNPLPRVKMGRHVRFVEADVYAYISACVQDSPAVADLAPVRARRSA